MHRSSACGYRWGMGNRLKAAPSGCVIKASAFIEYREGISALAIWLDQTSGDFEQRFAAFLTTKREVSEDVNTIVRAIIDDVRARGDVALAEYSKKFDGIDYAVTPMRVSEAEIDAAIEAVPSEVLGAL